MKESSLGVQGTETAWTSRGRRRTNLGRVAALLVGIDWALSAETVGRRLGRLVAAVLVTLLVTVVPIALLGIFMILQNTNPAA